MISSLSVQAQGAEDSNKLVSCEAGQRVLLKWGHPSEPRCGRGIWKTVIGQVLCGLWFDLSPLRMATLVQREKAGDSQGQDASRGKSAPSGKVASAPSHSL